MIKQFLPQKLKLLPEVKITTTWSKWKFRNIWIWNTLHLAAQICSCRHTSTIVWKQKTKRNEAQSEWERRLQKLFRNWLHLFLKASGLSLQWLWWNLKNMCHNYKVLVEHVLSFTKVNQKGIIYKFPGFAFCMFFILPISHPPPSNICILPCQ